MTYAYDEAVLDLLRLTIPTYGILVPIIQRSGTNEIIDGRHRMKVREELQAQGVSITLPVHHVDTDNPELIDQIVNSARRPWQDADKRKELVRMLREKGHSYGKIADAVGVVKSTVQKDLTQETATVRNRTVAPAPSKGKDGKTRKPPAAGNEITEAWAKKDAGMSAPAIAKELGRGERTVQQWFNKERPAATEPAKPVPRQPKQPSEPPKPAPLHKASLDLINRERKQAARRVELLKALVELDKDLTADWKWSQKQFDRYSRPVWREHVKRADQKMVEDGLLAEIYGPVLGLPPDATYEQVHRQIEKILSRMAHSVKTNVNLLVYILSFSEY